MTITPTNIFAYGDSGQSLSRMKDDELHKVRYNYDNGWVIGCFNACDGGILWGHTLCRREGGRSRVDLAAH